MIHVTCRLTAKNRDHLRDPTLGNRLCMGHLNLSTHQTHNSSEYSPSIRSTVCARVCCRVCSVRRAGGTRRLGASVRTCVATATRCASTTRPSATRRTWCRRRARCRRGRPADTSRSASRRHSAATTVGRSACWTQSRFATSNTGCFEAKILGEGLAHPLLSLPFLLPKFPRPPIRSKKVKVKFSHTRYRALGPELIPVYRQSARR